MPKNPIDAKKTMLRHSAAKVEFFKKYLERYLRILYLAPYISEINIFDVFCGTGIYDNDKKGSPIAAFEAIKEIRKEYGYEKTIKLTVNDSEIKKIDSVQGYINERNQNYCSMSYYNLPANEMFELMKTEIDTQNRQVRNVIFIDPYGYKEIKKEILENLLENRRTEIILFLPISHMHRFTATAVASDLKPYEPLRTFVHSFFPDNHPIREQKVTALEYIEFIKDALQFEKYYSASFYIKRDASNYYALFFVSHNLYGFHKILEVKWQLDEDNGRGFSPPNPQSSLLDKLNREFDKLGNYQALEKILIAYLATPKNNRQIYEIVVSNSFLPKHAVEIFKNWQRDNPKFQVMEVSSNQPARKGSFYITWEGYNKSDVPKVMFVLS